MPDRPRPASVTRRTVVLVALVLAGWVLAAGPAAAHDRLLGSEPADGATVEQVPEAVVLTFTADQLPVGAAVVVRDAAGTDHADGEPVVQGPTVTQPLAPDLPAGAYTVQWRSVSSDGHPIEGSLTFDVSVGSPQQDGAGQDEAQPSASAAPPETAAPAQADAGGTDSSADGTAAVGTDAVGGDPSDPGSMVPIGAGLAAAAAAAVALALTLRRTRTTAQEAAR